MCQLLRAFSLRKVLYSAAIALKARPLRASVLEDRVPSIVHRVSITPPHSKDLVV